VWMDGQRKRKRVSASLRLFRKDRSAPLLFSPLILPAVLHRGGVGEAARRSVSDRGFDSMEKTPGHSEGMDAPPGPPVASGLPEGREQEACDHPNGAQLFIFLRKMSTAAQKISAA